MTERTDVKTSAPAETPNQDHGLRVTAVSHDDGLRIELDRAHLLTAAQARRLAADLLAEADKIDR